MSDPTPHSELAARLDNLEHRVAALEKHCYFDEAAITRAVRSALDLDAQAPKSQLPKH